MSQPVSSQEHLLYMVLGLHEGPCEERRGVAITDGHHIDAFK